MKRNTTVTVTTTKRLSLTVEEKTAEDNKDTETLSLNSTSCYM